jgi:protein-L-isoaspartate(D-aspartate) O-methyltransferase
MVDGLVARRMVADPRVVEALREVPRHFFVPDVSVEEAYEDRAITTKYANGRPSSSASQPSIVARMLGQLQVEPGHSVLEIGSGTGYNAALLARLAGETGRVVTVDIAPDLVETARDRLTQAGMAQVEVVCGDGADGWAERAPYDRIVVTAGSSDLAPAWWDQLAQSGCLVVPLSLAGVQQCVAFAWADGHLESESVCDCGFMPLHGAMAHSDVHYDVPGYPGVRVDIRPGRAVDVGTVARSLSQPGSLVDIGVVATPVEVVGSLRRWLAYREPRSAQLSCTGLVDEVVDSVVPKVLEISLDPSRRHRETAVLLGDGGIAALDRSSPEPTTSDPLIAVSLAVRPFGTATVQVERLVELIRAWDAAGRPTTSGMKIAAYRWPDPAPRPPGSFVEQTRNATFVIIT